MIRRCSFRTFFLIFVWSNFLFIFRPELQASRLNSNLGGKCIRLVSTLTYRMVAKRLKPDLPWRDLLEERVETVGEWWQQGKLSFLYNPISRYFLKKMAEAPTEKSFQKYLANLRTRNLDFYSSQLVLQIDEVYQTQGFERARMVVKAEFFNFALGFSKARTDQELINSVPASMADSIPSKPADRSSLANFKFRLAPAEVTQYINFISAIMKSFGRGNTLQVADNFSGAELLARSPPIQWERAPASDRPLDFVENQLQPSDSDELAILNVRDITIESFYNNSDLKRRGFMMIFALEQLRKSDPKAAQDLAKNWMIYAVAGSFRDVSSGAPRAQMNSKPPVNRFAASFYQYLYLLAEPGLTREDFQNFFSRSPMGLWTHNDQLWAMRMPYDLLLPRAKSLGITPEEIVTFVTAHRRHLQWAVEHGHEEGMVVDYVTKKLNLIQDFLDLWALRLGGDQSKKLEVNGLKVLPSGS